MNKSGLLLMSMLSLVGCAGQEGLAPNDAVSDSSTALSASAQASNRISLRVQATANKDGATLTPTSAQVGTFALTPTLANDDGENWRVEALDASGQVVHSVTVRSNLKFNVETFNPNTGAIAEARTVDVPQDVFEVSLPFGSNVASINIELDDTSTSRVGPARLSKGRFARSALEQLSQQSQASRSAMAASATATTLIKNGAPANQMDYVFIGDGYTAAQMDQWHADAKKVIDGFMADPLFNANRAVMNVHRVDIASAQSGADESDNGITRDTALGAYFNCNQTARLLCVDNAKVRDVVGSVLGADSRDVIVVVVNSTRYGGAGGGIATLSMATQSIEIALHEIGHTAFGLADEYDYGTCNLSSEPAAGDVSLNGTRSVKWKSYIASSTPVPTPAGKVSNGTVGVFQGAQYCPTGKYRPTENSRMRTLGLPWHPVNLGIARDVFAKYKG
jgi:hypothetical protein